MTLKTERLKGTTLMDERHFFILLFQRRNCQPVARQYSLVVLKKGLVIGGGCHRNKRSELLSSWFFLVGVRLQRKTGNDSE